MRINVGNEKTRKLLAKISEALFGKNDEEKLIELLTDRIIELKKKFGLPLSFKDLHIDIDENQIKKLFNKTLDDPRMKNNIVSIDGEIIFELIKKLTKI